MSSFIYPPSSCLSKQVKLVKFASQMINREEMWCLGKTFSQEGCDNVTFSFLNSGESSEVLRCWYCCVISSWLEPSEECIFVCPEAISGMKVMQGEIFRTAFFRGPSLFSWCWRCQEELVLSCGNVNLLVHRGRSSYYLRARGTQQSVDVWRKVANRSHVSGNSCRLLVVS